MLPIARSLALSTMAKACQLAEPACERREHRNFVRRSPRSVEQ